MGLIDGNTPKCETGTSGRGVQTARTLASVEPFFGELGITRVANVTGLDRIGIPVWQAVRPASRGLSVSQGKGVDHDAAKVSAVMESLEQHHGENTEVACRMTSYRSLRRTADVADPDLLPMARHSTFSAERTLPWCAAVDEMGGGTVVWVPFELVHADAVLPRVPGSGSFLRSTNGLASGNSLTEAVLHGLCELVERDAHAMWLIGGDDVASATRVDPATVRAGTCRDLLDRYAAAGIDVALWDMTSDLDVATYRCIISDPESEVELNPVPAAYGAGCHPDPAIALARALTEAAQSRLASIAGSRDDLTRAAYDDNASAEAIAAQRRLHSGGPLPVDASDRAGRAGGTVEDDLSAVLDRIAAVGLRQVLWVDLSRAGWPVKVVRVIAPGLEGPSSSPLYRPGPRATAAAARRPG